ncbi:MAG: hypothetical protein AAF358_08005 [Pseudomonadota bacterium]
MSERTPAQQRNRSLLMAGALGVVAVVIYVVFIASGVVAAGG